MKTLNLFVILLTIIVTNKVALADKPLKIFILAGQSNMQGHASVETFKHIGMDKKTAPLLKEILDSQGKPKVCDRVWISYLHGMKSGEKDHEKNGKLTTGFGAQNGNKIGPEFGFGITMEKLTDHPILIIKTAWGGKSMHTDFRSPAGGEFKFNESDLDMHRKKGRDVKKIIAEKNEATGLYYRTMLTHVKNILQDIKRVYPDYDPKIGYEIAGFVWFQGWNDMVDRGVYPNRDKAGGYDTYSEILSHFIRDIRKELAAPKIPFVIGVMGVGGILDLKNPNRYTPIHNNFRKAMAAPAETPEFKDNVKVVLTENYWDKELSELDSRWGKVKQKSKELAKNKEITAKERKAALNQFISETYTKEELEIKKAGISNFGFHYLGSAKILVQIGKAFAEALEEE
jgi:hypothetical protein